MKTLEFNSLEPGMEFTPLHIGKITHATLIRYAGASGDFNPIHNNPEIAKEYGLDGTIAHGMLIMGYIARFCTSLTDKRRIHDLSVKFKGMAKPGQTIVCTGKVKKKKEEEDLKFAIISVEASDENGEVKATGEMTVICD